MLKQETIQKIEQILKIKGLMEAIKAEGEVDLTLEDVQVYTPDELTQLRNNEYKNGKEKGVEMAVKELKEKRGLDFQGKTIEGLLEAASKKALEDARIEPEARVKELSQDLEKVRKENERLAKSLTDKETEALRAKTDRKLFQEVPETTLGAEDLIDFARLKGLDFRLDETGKIVPYKDGEPVKDNLANIRPAKDVLSEFAKQYKLAKEEEVIPGGRGGGDNKPAPKFSSLSELKKDLQSRGLNLQGEEAGKIIMEAAKDPEFDLSK